MTQQQIVQEFKSYPKAQKSVVIRQLLRIFEADLEETRHPNGNELSIEEMKIRRRKTSRSCQNGKSANDQRRNERRLLQISGVKI